MFDFLFEIYRNDIKYCTWEPDGDDEDNPGTWGMFIDDFPPELFDKVVEFLESENSWVLDKEVEMALDDDGLMYTGNIISMIFLISCECGGIGRRTRLKIC